MSFAALVALAYGKTVYEIETRLMCPQECVHPQEFQALIDYYKGKITKSTLLDKAACVATEAQLVLNDPHTPAGLKEPVAKTLLARERDLTEQLRAIPSCQKQAVVPERLETKIRGMC